MIEFDQLLHPLAGDDPCGIDLEGDSRFNECSSLVESGRPDDQTDWKKVKRLSLDLCQDWRSIETLVHLVVSLTATEGYSGFKDGITLLCRSITEFWDDIYPKLDMEEPEDERYIMRLNLLEQLGMQVKSFGDPYEFLEKIMQAPLDMTGKAGKFSYYEIFLFKQNLAEDIDENSIHNFFTRMDASAVEELKSTLNEVLESLKGLDSFLSEKTGYEYTHPFNEHLYPLINQILATLAQYKSDSATEAVVPEVNPAAQQQIPAGEPAGAAVPVAAPVKKKAIETSEDVTRALNQIISYYKENEPSSPIPYLLQRAKKLIDADFIKIIENLNSESEYTFRTTLDINED